MSHPPVVAISFSGDGPPRAVRRPRQRAGNTAEAIDYYRVAARMLAEVGDQWLLSATLHALGAPLRDSGQPAAARDAWQEAIELLSRLDPPATVGLRSELERLPA